MLQPMHLDYNSHRSCPTQIFTFNLKFSSICRKRKGFPPSETFRNACVQSSQNLFVPETFVGKRKILLFQVNTVNLQMSSKLPEKGFVQDTDIPYVLTKEESIIVSWGFKNGPAQNAALWPSISQWEIKKGQHLNDHPYPGKLWKDSTLWKRL